MCAKKFEFRQLIGTRSYQVEDRQTEIRILASVCALVLFRDGLIDSLK